jgi:hypothetical protein
MKQQQNGVNLILKTSPNTTTIKSRGIAWACTTIRKMRNAKKKIITLPKEKRSL